MNRKVSFFRTLAIAAAVICLIMAGSALMSTGVYADDNLAEAQEKYGVTDNSTILVKNMSGLEDALYEAEERASADQKVIIYAAPGTYRVRGRYDIPDNVILVGEDDTKYVSAGGHDVMFQLHGCIYGGYFDSNKKTKTTIKFMTENGFKDGNGVLEKATIINSNNYGVVAIYKEIKDAVVKDCTVTKCKASGIAILSGAYIKTIEGCNVSDNGTAGINLSFADVGDIKDCQLNRNIDKAVSTNSDNKSGCTINSITGCTIKNNVTNGVHIKPNCTLNRFEGNTLIGNDDGIIAAAITAEKTHGKSIIKNVMNNTFKSSKTQQIEAQGKGAKIIMKSGNKVISGKGYGILALNKGKVQIKGSNNVFTKNYKGIGAQSRGSIIIVGNNNQFTKNKFSGFHAAINGVIKIKGKNNKIAGNKKYAIYCATKAKIQLKGVKIKGRIVKGRGGKVTRKK